MKRLKFHRAIVAIAMMLIGWLPSLAHDFKVNGIFYKKTSDNTVAVTFKGSSYISYSKEYSGDIVIPSSVKYNGVTYSVTSIGNNAFRECSSLTSIEIGNSVTSIGVGAFSACTSLTSIEIPDSVTSIGNNAFSDDSLTSVVIGNSVTSIGEWAFSWSALTEIKCWATTPPTIYYSTFTNYSADLYVPVGCKSAYQSANYWKNFNIINDTLDNPITLNDNDAIVATVGDNIVVKNATAGSVVRVYTADGAMIATGVATEGDVIIEVPAKGVYVVKVGKQTVKVII